MPLKTMIRGVRDLDGKFAAMMKIKLLCEESGVDCPGQVIEYCGACIKETEEYCRKEMEEIDVGGAVEKRMGPGNDEYDQWEIYLAALPAEVVRIRVVM